MLQINVSQLLKEPIGSIRDYIVEGIFNISGEKGSEVSGEVTLTRTDRGILVKGVVNTEVVNTCNRCLGQFTCPMTFTLEEEYFPVINIVTGTPVSVADEPGSFTIDEHHTIDLTEAVRQYALLALPMKLLCREDCAGICARCGHNLNLGSCDCSSQEIDPRLAKLKNLVFSDE